MQAPQSLSVIIAMPRNREAYTSQVIYLSHMDGGDSCVLTYVSHECGCEHRSYIYREGEPCLCEQHCKDGSDTYCQDQLEYGISIHICVALMFFLILHQQAVILVCCCIKQAMLFNQSFPRGPPIRLPKMRLKVAAAVQMVVAPFMFSTLAPGQRLLRCHVRQP